MHLLKKKRLRSTALMASPPTTRHICIGGGVHGFEFRGVEWTGCGHIAWSSHWAILTSISLAST